MTRLILIDDMQAINDWQKKVFAQIIKNINPSKDESNEKIAVIDATQLSSNMKELLRDESSVVKKFLRDESLSGDEKSIIDKFVESLLSKIENYNEDKDNLVFVIDYRWDNSPDSDDKSGLICAQVLGRTYKDKSNVKIILVSSKIHEVGIKEENIIWCKRPFFERTEENTVKPDNGTTTDNSSVVERLNIKEWANESDEIKRQIYSMCTSCYIKYQFIGCVMACLYSFAE